MRALFLTGVISVLATGCSLTAAGGLDECETSADCASDQVCTQQVCLPLPAGCRAEPYGSTEADAIRMGGLFPLHISPEPGASEDESDVQGLNAALLALEEVNQRTRIALYVCDTGSSKDVAEKQARWLVNDKKVAALLTAGSSQTLAVADVALPAGVLTMSYSASSPELTAKPDTNGGPVGLLWRTSPSDAIQGSVIANLLRSDSRFGAPAKVGILYVDDPYGQGLSNIISEQLSTGATRVANRTFLYQRGGDVKAVLDSLDMTYDPDVTVLIGFADDAKTILKEAATRNNLKRENGHRWFFSDSVKDSAVLADALAANQARGFYGTAPAQGTGQAFSTFSDRFVTKYQKNPAAYAYTSNAYDAMYLLALGASYSLSTTNAVTGVKIAEALNRVSSGASSTSTQLTNSNFTGLAAQLASGQSVNIEGASGPLNFDVNGEARAPVELWQVSDTGFVTIANNLEP
ncbi:ABC transporter substrate-binding protein [Archangium violaceum]|uniref:Receptor ligand binding region domain-containing protein n=1 Tax=Archangium violaceum Cb vi76 TaxID=1406225 RepID=A0A084SPH9_9BACT|nr:ABC transporter substrate-binding protein [Archangium violaceum]KFA90364.1 hypothetical protein Q664_29015 [Archangium violaceum Cb vi76]